jgi:hypothetical protein
MLPYFDEDISFEFEFPSKYLYERYKIISDSVQIYAEKIEDKEKNSEIEKFIGPLNVSLMGGFIFRGRVILSAVKSIQISNPVIPSEGLSVTIKDSFSNELYSQGGGMHADKNWDTYFNMLIKTIFPIIIEKILNEIEGKRSVKIGDLNIELEGIRIARKISRWKDIKVDVDSGTITLTDMSSFFRKKHSIHTFVENAVVVPDLIDFMQTTT